MAEEFAQRRGALGSVLPPILTALVLLSAWQAICAAGLVPRFLVPGPIDIVASIVRNAGTLGSALLLTAAEALATLIVSTALGVLVALLFAAFRTAERLAIPYIVILQAVPIVATAPLIIIWFGPDFRSIVVIAVLMTTFPILSNMLTGLKATDRQLLELFRLSRATPWQTFIRLRIPAAIPYLGVGLRIASPLAVIGVIVGEYVAGLGSGGAGLGFLITQSALRLDTAGVFAAGFAASAVGILFWQGTNWLVRGFLKDWHETEAERR